MNFEKIFARKIVRKKAKIPEIRIAVRIIERFVKFKLVSCETATAAPVRVFWIANKVINDKPRTIVFIEPRRIKNSF